MREITQDELLSVFKRTGLLRIGFSFQKACATPAVLISMRCAVKASIKKQQTQEKQDPYQPALF